MGIDYWTEVVVGVPLSTGYEIEKVQEEVPVYSRNTGKQEGTRTVYRFNFKVLTSFLGFKTDTIYDEEKMKEFFQDIWDNHEDNWKRDASISERYPMVYGEFPYINAVGIQVMEIDRDHFAPLPKRKVLAEARDRWLEFYPADKPQTLVGLVVSY